jgi:excisionase family DNA binding protein
MKGQDGSMVERISVRTDTTVRRLLSVDEVAEVLGVPVRTLYQWRHKGVGPVGLRVGRHLRYRAADVSEWIDRRAADEANSRRG